MVSNLNLGYIDYIFALFILIYAVHSFLKGFKSQLIAIVVLILSAFIAYKLSPYTVKIIQPVITNYINSRLILVCLAFIINYVVFYCLLALLTQALMNKLPLSSSIVDKLLGLLLGGVKALIIIVFFYAVIDLIIPSRYQPSLLTKSYVREKIIPVEKLLYSYINNASMKLN